MLRPKKIHTRNLMTKKSFLRLKNCPHPPPPPPAPRPITFLKVHPLSIHLLCLFLFLFSNGLSRVQPNSQLFSTQLCCLRLRLINQLLEEKIHKNGQSRGLKWPEVSKRKRREEFTGIEEGFN